MPSSVDLYKVDAEDIGRVLVDHLVARLLAKAVERSRGKQDGDDIAAAIETGRMQLWLLAAPGQIAAIALTEISEYPRKKVCRVIACVGEGRERWQHHLAGIEDWAKEIGCDGMELVARKGWARVMSDYELTHVMLEKGI